MAATMMDEHHIGIHPPNTVEHPFQPHAVPYANLLGPWHVIASTLPMWKGKKNVIITYSLIDGEPDSTFDDLVEYHSSLTADPTSKKKTVRGVDRLETDLPLIGSSSHHSVPGDSSSTPATSGARWKWRGKGLLGIASSHWQLLGYNVKGASSGSGKGHLTGEGDDEEWVVTYFSKTLFTPAGLDVYARGGRLSAGTKKAITEATKAVKDDQIAKLAQTLFDIPHDA